MKKILFTALIAVSLMNANEFENAMSQVDKSISRLIKENKATIKTVDEMKLELKAHNKSTDETVDELRQDLKRQNTEQQKKIDHLENELKRLTKENQALEKRISKLEQQRKNKSE